MSTKTFTVHVYVRADFDGEPTFTVFGYDLGKQDKNFGVNLGSHTFDFEMPAGFSLTAAEIATIEAEKLAALEEFQKTTKRLNERLAKLQAITNEVPA